MSLDLTRKLALGSLTALSFLVSFASSATAAEFKITFESFVTNEAGNFFSPVSFIPNDGTFDPIEVGTDASLGIDEISQRGDGTTLLSEAADAGFTNTFILASGQSGEPIGFAPDFFPGEMSMVVVDLDTTEQFLTAASMVLPSNDAFTGTADPVQIFDDQGNLIVNEIDLNIIWDAGSEVNDQEAPNAAVAQRDPISTAFPFNNVNAGLGGGDSEGGLITLHPGYINGGIFTNAGTSDTLTFGDITDLQETTFARITIEEVTVPEPSATAGILALGGLSVLAAKAKKNKKS